MARTDMLLHAFAPFPLFPAASAGPGGVLEGAGPAWAAGRPASQAAAIGTPVRQRAPPARCGNATAPSSTPRLLQQLPVLLLLQSQCPLFVQVGQAYPAASVQLCFPGMSSYFNASVALHCLTEAVPKHFSMNCSTSIVKVCLPLITNAACLQRLVKSPGGLCLRSCRTVVELWRDRGLVPTLA